MSMCSEGQRWGARPS